MDSLSTPFSRAGSGAIPNPYFISDPEPHPLYRGASARLSRMPTMLSADVLTIHEVISQYGLHHKLSRMYAQVKVYDKMAHQMRTVSPDELRKLDSKQVWINVVLSSHSHASSSCRSVLDWLDLLCSKFKLPALSLVNAVIPGNDTVKVDRTENCLYMSLIAFGCNSMCLPAAGADLMSGYGPAQDSPLHSDSLMSQPIAENSEATPDVEAPKRARGMSLRAVDGDKPRCVSRIKLEHDPSWQRVAMFLTDTAFISIFEDGCVLDSMRHQLPKTIDFSYGLGFLLYRLVERTVKLTSVLVGVYEDAIIAIENMILDETRRLTYAQDVANTKELHLMRNELAMIKHMVAPTHRVLNTVLSEYGAGSGKTLVSDVAVDYLEEVVDELVGMNEDIEVAISNCEQVSNLVFNLSTYHDTKNGSVLTMIATVFMPLTWLCGIYGMNFDILPELHWRLGYLWFWGWTFVMVVLTLGVLALLNGWHRKLGRGGAEAAGPPNASWHTFNLFAQPSLGLSVKKRQAPKNSSFRDGPVKDAGLPPV